MPAEKTDFDQHLPRLFAEVAESVKQMEDQTLWEVELRSSLAADDAKTDPYHLSHSVRAHLGTAVDHMHAMVNLTEHARVLHPFAPFTLARAAIETASVACWLILPPSRKERVCRRLRLASADADDGYQVSDELEIQRIKTLHDVRDRIAEVGQAAGLSRAEVLQRPRSTNAVKVADAAGAGLHPLAAWRICSGIAHGRQWASLSFLPREEIDADPRTQVSSLRITSDSDRLAWVLAASLDVARTAGSAYYQRARDHRR